MMMTMEQVKGYKTPTTVPDLGLTAEEVVTTALAVLKHNKRPTPSAKVSFLCQRHMLHTILHRNYVIHWRWGWMFHYSEINAKRCNMIQVVVNSFQLFLFVAAAMHTSNPLHLLFSSKFSQTHSVPFCYLFFFLPMSTMMICGVIITTIVTGWFFFSLGGNPPFFFFLCFLLCTIIAAAAI